MQDRNPTPPWGFPTIDDRDLDALLAGKVPPAESTGASPPALRQVADTLAALRAAPSSSELRGEAGIRAEFRAIAEFRALGRSGAGPRPATATSLTGSGPRRHGTRKRKRGRPGPGRRGYGRRDQPPARARRGRLAAGAFAAVALVLAATAAYSGRLPGPAQRLAHVALAAPSGIKTSSGTDAKSARAVVPPSHSAAAHSPAPAPAVSSAAAETPAASPVRLCDAFYTSLEHPSPNQDWWQTPAYKQVSAAAGGPERVPGYCAAEWSRLHPHDYPQVPVFPGSANQGAGSQGTEDQGTGSASGNQPATSGTSGSQGDGTASTPSEAAPSEAAPSESTQPGPAQG